MLHEDLARVPRRHRFFCSADDLARRLRAVDSGIDVAASGDFEAAKTLQRLQLSDDLFGYLAGSLSQTLRQLKAERQSILAHLEFGRLLDHNVQKINVLKFDLVLTAQKIADVLDKTALQLAIQFRSFSNR
jgi:ADP-dependent phosphofructokinase/glucokinase